MGCFQRTGTADRAPLYSSNDGGIPRWSEKHVTEFDEQLCAELRAFIQREARIRGHNDRHYGDKPLVCIFDPDFLEGWPYRLWQEIYSLSYESGLMQK